VRHSPDVPHRTRSRTAGPVGGYPQVPSGSAERGVPVTMELGTSHTLAPNSPLPGRCASSAPAPRTSIPWGRARPEHPARAR
jgi:hypothetical protein